MSEVIGWMNGITGEFRRNPKYRPQEKIEKPEADDLTEICQLFGKPIYVRLDWRDPEQAMSIIHGSSSGVIGRRPISSISANGPSAIILAYCSGVNLSALRAAFNMSASCASATVISQQLATLPSSDSMDHISPSWKIYRFPNVASSIFADPIAKTCAGSIVNDARRFDSSINLRTLSLSIASLVFAYYTRNIEVLMHG